ncbi:hypothetical protein D9758_014003 [Tetrapyrgos nigripes]|uniref:Uncharacterized protein n=1 Tax=Tetrapyrgos nigripes TaxID=182062 RepID=A0A8H5CZA0_9AGAR|nr:hypothetical protein D9758_014003 [Tetrapyrgos nigripes]
MAKYVPVIMLILEALVLQFSHFLHSDLQSYLIANGVTSQPSTQFYIGISILFIAGFIRYRCYTSSADTSPLKSVSFPSINSSPLVHTPSSDIQATPDLASVSLVSL